MLFGKAYPCSGMQPVTQGSLFVKAKVCMVVWLYKNTYWAGMADVLLFLGITRKLFMVMAAEKVPKVMENRG